MYYSFCTTRLVVMSTMVDHISYFDSLLSTSSSFSFDLASIKEEPEEQEIILADDDNVDDEVGQLFLPPPSQPVSFADYFAEFTSWWTTTTQSPAPALVLPRRGETLRRGEILRRNSSRHSDLSAAASSSPNVGECYPSLPSSTTTTTTESSTTLMAESKYATISAYMQHVRHHKHHSALSAKRETCNRRANDQFPAGTTCDLLLSQNVDHAVTYLDAQLRGDAECLHFTESPDDDQVGVREANMYIVTFSTASAGADVYELHRIYHDNTTSSSSGGGDHLVLELLYSQHPKDVQLISHHSPGECRGPIISQWPDRFTHARTTRSILRDHLSATQHHTYFVIDPRVFFFFGDMTLSELTAVIPRYCLAPPHHNLTVKDRRIRCIRPRYNELPM